MAYILQISQAQYSKLETGKVVWDTDKLGEVLDVLDLNFLEVVKLSEKQEILIRKAIQFRKQFFIRQNKNVKMIFLINQLIY